MAKLNIQLLLTGDELMSGHVVETNSIMMADILKTQGLIFTCKVIVPDDLAQLVTEIERLSLAADILIINGGLGPTVDDKTAQALSLATKQSLAEHSQAMSHLQAWCLRRGFELNGPNKKQAMLPKGVELLHNATGSAPGFSITHNKCFILCIPGVPSEAKEMLLNSIMPLLKKHHNPGFTQVVRLQTFGLGESRLQEWIQTELSNWPNYIELGFRSAFPYVEVKLTAHDKKSAAELPQWQQKITNLLGAHIIGEGGARLPELLVNLLQEKKQKLTLAESCTGGLIAAKLTSVAGASMVFEGGVVSYSNEIKSKILGVQKTTLEKHGAVSEQVVIEMARGALELTQAQWSIAVSGIAGPDGGTKDKPVGTVWIAWGQATSMKAHKLYCPSNRKQFQEYVAFVALDLMRRAVMGIKETPYYIKS